MRRFKPLFFGVGQFDLSIQLILIHLTPPFWREVCLRTIGSHFHSRKVFVKEQSHGFKVKLGEKRRVKNSCSIAQFIKTFR